jgi:outer membrane receptor protein involved in Fe transport
MSSLLRQSGQGRLALLLALGLFAPTATAAGQSLTSAALSGVVRDSRGVAIRAASVTVEQGGAVYRILTADAAGRFTLSSLPAGRYSLLVEQVGYQPVRVTGIPLAVGREQYVRVELPQRPPPVLAVEEQPFRGATASGIVLGDALDRFDRRRDITDITRDASMVDLTLDGRRGFVSAANGMAPAASRLMVDGLEELLLRHPGEPGEPAIAPLFARDGIAQAELMTFGLDAELRSSPGALLTAQTARGDGRFRFAPYGTFSGAALGGAAADNAGDSSATSIQAGFAASGAIKGDTASWFVRLDYQQLQQPTAEPFALGGRELASAIEAIAPGTSPAALSPPVRTWNGVTGSGRMDWRFGDWSRLAVRFGLANWTEDAPQLGRTLTSGAGSRLESSDLSGAVSFTTGGLAWTSETRLGVRASERDWRGASDGQTSILAEGAAFGTAASLPGRFEEGMVELAQALSYRYLAHRFRVGVQAATRSFTHDWWANSAGRTEFGDLTQFELGRGSFVRAEADGAAPDLSVTEAAFFAQDVWRATPTLELTVGVRYAVQQLPEDEITLNTEWGIRTGVPNLLMPETKGVFAPRGGVRWDPSGDGRTLINLAAGISPGRHDLATLSEVVRSSRGVNVSRAVGDLGSAGSATETNAPTLTLYGPEVRMPRSFFTEASLARVLGAGTTLHLRASYAHTDYLLRRDDLNLVPGAVATDADGRTLRGTLVQQGGLITALPGTNRRFAEFDHVFAMSSPGFADHYAMTLGVTRDLGRGLMLDGSYTWSRTEDNLVGQLESDPADRLSPFAGSAEQAAWDEGRSDLDIPHRVAVQARFATPGENPLTLGARWRYRSGLPFTPGFRRGVDANGDGAGANDPVALSSVTGLAGLLSGAGCASGSNGFAERNSCREDAVQALDLHASIGLPLGGARRVRLTLDAFNVVASETGIIDRAAVLVDPAGSITMNAAGRTVLPLVLNDNFGGLLARRGDPRTLRIGLRVEN